MAEPLGQMVIELGLDSSAFGKGITGAKQQVKYAMAEMKSGMSVMSASGRQLDVLQQKQRGLTNVMTAQERVVRSLKQSYDNSFVNGKATTQTGKLATQLQNATSKLASFKTQLANNAGAMAKMRVETTGWTGALNKIGQGATSVGTKMSAMGSAVNRVSGPVALGLGLAAKSAIDFDSQISAMGPLLTNGGAVTAKFRAQLDQLSSSSKKWSEQYGISTTDINNAMSEMIKRGFTTKQVMGSMPAVLDASKASGESLGTVMQATASIVEQFGLKTNSVKGTMKNTQMVTDSLTYAANATAAGFGDMSEAMSYVGPVAKGLGLSVQETAAAIGILSNRGIEGQKAGTNLRGMLTSLVKPTKQNTAAFKSMGMSAKDLNEDSHNLPKLIDDISNGTKGWTKAERTHAIAQAFGRENQAAVNALVESGSDSLRKLTKNTEDAGGATKKVADQLNDTKANQIKRFQSSIQVLGITIGEKLLPTLTPLVKEATDVVNGFAHMDSATQKTIIHMGLAVAAAGPLLKTLGGITKGFGLVSTGVVGVIARISGWSAKNAVLKGSLDATAAATSSNKTIVDKFGNALNGTSKTLTTVNGTTATAKTGFQLFGKSLTVAQGGVGVLGTALTPLGATLIGVGVAVAAGVAVWELWGKKAYESAKRTAEWGSDVGTAADKSLGKFKSFETTAGASLNNFSINGKKSAKSVSKAFDDMAKQVDSDAKKTNSGLEKSLSKLPTSVQALVRKGIEETEKSNTKAASSAKKTAAEVNTIMEHSAKDHYKLTKDEGIMVGNAQQSMADQELKVLGISGKKKKAILAAMNNDVSKMTKDQLNQTRIDLEDSLDKEADRYTKQKKVLKDYYKDGTISSKEYKAAVKELGSTHKQTDDQIVAGLYNTMKASGMSTNSMKAEFSSLGYTWSSVKKIIDDQAQSASKSGSALVKTTTGMSKSVKAAANTWNELIFDPKTGKVSTNAQEEINKATGSSKDWNAIMLLAKKGHLSTNATEMVAKAAIEKGKWDSMTWKEQKALIRSEGGEKITDLLMQGGMWNQLTLKQQEAIVNSKGGTDLLGSLSKMGVWNSMTLKEQKIAFNDAGSQSKIVKAVGSVKDWNALTPKQQQLLASSNSPEVVAKGINNVDTWNQLPVPVKNLLANDSKAAAVLRQAGINIDQYALKKPGEKKLSANSQDLDSKLAGANAKIQNFSSGNANKNLTASNNTGTGTASAHNTIQSRFLGPNGTKNLFASNNAGGGSSSAHSTVQNSFLGPNGTKKLFASNNAGSGTSSAHSTVSGFMGMNATKSIKASNGTGGGISSARSSINSVHGKSVTITAVFNAVAHGTKALLKKFGLKNGTTNFQGGYATVNDQLGGTFRELVKLPTGETFIPHGRNVTIPLPKRAQVIPATRTAKMFPGLPQFAKGLNVPTSSDIIQQPKEVIQTLTVSDNQSSNNALVAQNNQLVAQVKMLASGITDLIKAVADQNSKQVVITMNGDVMADGLAPLISKRQDKISVRENRLRGFR
ncbi:phage tail tape measure protein [Paucilactobacillus kaifaensis]|uniref:phage tail tape measure protein n=1 Tax=Paucilactobacillus kaifaensis TaxID=2559921 RepID=UPI001485ABAE|nr:phage tail tape measure protein [Paucilactobacillus kaifaensis]